MEQLYGTLCAHTMHGPVVLVYRGSVHQYLYTYTIEPGSSLASVEVGDKTNWPINRWQYFPGYKDIGKLKKGGNNDDTFECPRYSCIVLE